MNESIFSPGGNYSVGVELEVRLLDSKTYLPKNASTYIFDNLPKQLEGHVHKELLQSMVEIVTPVCHSAEEAIDFISKTLKEVAAIGEGADMVLATLATHPFEAKSDNKIFHDPRYEAFAKELQIVLTNFLISGLHIHVGMPSDEAAIRGYNATIKYMPIFLALSANSPFHHGEDTGLQSYRTEIFQQLPRSGIPQSFDSYEEYDALMRLLKETKTIKTIKDVWWDVRIHELFGTVEMRICDAFYDPERLRLIVLFYQALMMYAAQKPVEKEFYQVTRQNKWNAVRHAMRGKYIDGHRVTTIRDAAKTLLDAIDSEGIFAQLGSGDDVGALKEMINDEPMSRKLRKIYEETGDFKKVIAWEIVR